MKIFLFLFLNFLGIIFSQTSLTSKIFCHPDNGKRCFRYIQGDPILSRPLLFLSDFQLNSFCSLFSNFSNCYKPLQNHCLFLFPLNLSIQLEGNFQSYNYLCVDKNKEYNKIKYCFKKNGIKLGINKCHVTIKEEINEALNNNNSLQLCRAGDVYMGCVDNYIKVNCPDQTEASDWMKNFNKFSLEPIMSSLSCRGWEPNSPNDQQNNNIIAIKIILGIFSFIIFIGIIFLIIYCLKTRCYRNLLSFPRSFKCSPRPPPYGSSDLSFREKTKKFKNENKNKITNSKITTSEGGQIYFIGDYLNTESTTDDTSVTNDDTSSTSVESHNKMKIHFFLKKKQQKNSDSGFKGSKDLISQISGKESRISGQNSCTSTPSLFDPPTTNPFLKKLSQSSDPTPVINVANDYY